MKDVLLILGGLGVFLYGLRILSQGLQKVAGTRLRATLAYITQNRFSGVLSGFLITTAIQSSSATTVMIVSFANAGLLTLQQAIGPVMGANIGTTVTGWLVSLLGFKVKISAFALPVIGLGVPLSFFGNEKSKQWSEVLVGFGLLFLGLKFLKDGVPDLKHNPEQLAWLQEWANHGFASILLFILIGTILTIVVQSSSATMAITLTMAAAGWIGFDVAAAMVLGENLGTTITANLAALGANRTAKRVALSHTFFNVIGVLWVTPLIYPFMDLVDWLVPGTPLESPTTHLAAFHSTFNIVNTTLLIGFVRVLHDVVMKILPIRDDEHQEGPKLKHLSTSLLETPSLALEEVRRELQVMLSIVSGMFTEVATVLVQPREKLGALVDHIKKTETEVDALEDAIVEFCTDLAQAGINHRQAAELTRTLDLAGDIERMADHCTNLVLLAQRRYDKDHTIISAAQDELNEMSHLLMQLFALADRALDPETGSVRAEAKVVEEKVDKLRDEARKRHAQRMQDGQLTVREGLIFLDMMGNMERIGDYCFKICAVASERLD